MNYQPNYRTICNKSLTLITLPNARYAFADADGSILDLFSGEEMLDILNSAIVQNGATIVNW